MVCGAPSGGESQLEIADKIRLKLNVRLLPQSKPEKIYGGHGDGQPCSACDQPIVRAQVQYEFDTPDEHTFRFHVGCLGLWEAELLKRGWFKRPKPE